MTVVTDTFNDPFPASSVAVMLLPPSNVATTGKLPVTIGR